MGTALTLEKSISKKLAGAWALVVGCCLAVVTWGVFRPGPVEAIQQTPNFPSFWLARAFVHWDSGWYLHIAQHGYWYQPNEQSPVAFFPLYGLCIRGLQALGVNPYVAGMAITFSCGVIAAFLFFHWAKRLTHNETVAANASLLVFLYPYAFYLYGALYSDALFLMLVLAAFSFLEKQKLFWAVVFGALATATRPVAPAVVVGLWVRHLELRRQQNLPFRLADFAPLLAGAGLGAYMLFLQWKFGDPLAFAHVEGAPGWDHVMGWHSWLKMDLWHRLATHWKDMGAAYRVFHAGLTLLAFLLLWPTVRRLGLGYGVYAALAIGIPAVSSKDFHCMGRYLLAAFPVFLTAALWLEPRPKLRTLWRVGSFLAFLFLAYRFSRGDYVA